MPSRQPLSGRRRALANDVRNRLRVVNSQLSVLNHVVSARLNLRDVDLDCLDLIEQHGPISPSRLSARTGLHPATLTGILDRLQRAGWVVRERDPQAADRRGVAVRARRDRAGEVYRLYAGMISAMDEICSGYTAEELQLLAEFLGRVAGAGRDAITGLWAEGERPAGEEPPAGEERPAGERGGTA